jgi:hypothetical protein
MNENIKNAINYAFDNKVADMQKEIEAAIKDKLSTSLDAIKQDLSKDYLKVEEEIDEELIDHHVYSSHLKNLGGKVSRAGNVGVLFSFDHPDNAKQFNAVVKKDGWNTELSGTSVHVPNKLKSEMCKEDVEDISEVSKETHDKYKKAAVKDYDKNVDKANAKMFKKEDPSEPINKAVKRSEGIVRSNQLLSRVKKATAHFKSVNPKRLPEELVHEDVSSDMNTLSPTQFKRKHGKGKRYFRKYFK